MSAGWRWRDLASARGRHGGLAFLPHIARSSETWEPKFLDAGVQTLLILTLVVNICHSTATLCDASASRREAIESTHAMNAKIEKRPAPGARGARAGAAPGTGLRRLSRGRTSRRRSRGHSRARRPGLPASNHRQRQADSDQVRGDAVIDTFRCGLRGDARRGRRARAARRCTQSSPPPSPMPADARSRSPTRPRSCPSAATSPRFSMRSGLEASIIAVDATSQFPAEALKQKTNVGYMRALSTEGVLSIAPHLIIASASAGPPEVVKALKQTSVPYVEVGDGHSPEGVIEKVRFVAQALGVAAEGDKLARKIESRIQGAGRSACKDRQAQARGLRPRRAERPGDRRRLGHQRRRHLQARGSRQRRGIGQRLQAGRRRGARGDDARRDRHDAPVERHP